MFVENKKQFKDYLKIAGMRIIGILLPVLIMFIYLVVNGAIKDFVNYAILGISTFSNKIKYVKLFSNDKIEIRILSVLMPVSIIIMSMILIIANILKKENKNLINLLTILVYSLSIIIVMYPISDEIHFLIGGLIAIIGLIYVTFLLCKIIYDKIKINKKEFLDCIDRATLLVREGEKKPIIIEITDNSMELRIDSAMGSMNENIDIDKEGKDILIGFNPRFLIDALKVIDDETISIYLVNPKAPCFIRDDEENYTYLILPVNINQNQAR